MGLKTNKIYICLPIEKEVDKLDWDGLSTEKYNGKTYYKIPSGGNSSDVVKKITFETLKDNVTVTLNIVSSSEKNWDFAYACELDGTSGYSNAKYKISGDNQSITCEYVVPTKGSHWIHIGYRKDGSGNQYNDCGYFFIDNSYKEYVIRQPKEVYLASDKMNEITYGSKKILEHGLTNIIKWTGKMYNAKDNLYIGDSEVNLVISYSYTDYATNPYGIPRKGVAYLYNGNINSYYDLNNLYFWKEPKCKYIELEFSYDNNYSPLFNGIFKIPSSIDFRDVDFSRISYIDNLFYGWKGLNNIKLPNNFAKGKKSLRRLFYSSSNGYRYDGNNMIKSLDMANWDTSDVTDMSGMFNGCTYLDKFEIGKWDTSNVTDMSGMFSQNYKSNIPQYNAQYMKCTIIDVSKWNTSNVTDMNNMFNGCNALTSLDISNWDTGKVTDMNSMFNGCEALNLLDVSKFNTSNVTNMYCMFQYCKSITNLDVSNWDVSKVTNIGQIFYFCEKLTSLDLSKWDISNVTDDTSYILYLCKELKTLIDGHESEPNITALNGLKTNLILNNSTKLNYESVYALFRGAATVTSTKTITLPKVMEGKLDADKVKIATDKGWTIKYS